MKERGIAKVDGIYYTFEHAKKPPYPGARLYRVRVFIPYSDIPIHINTYYVSGRRLDDFLRELPETWETVTDIRPVTRIRAVKEMRGYK